MAKSKVIFKIVEDGIETTLKNIAYRSTDFRPLFKARIYPNYQQLQIERWKKHGGYPNFPSKWEPLNKVYKRKKLSIFKNFPYRGTKDLVATGRLIASVVGPSSKMKSQGHSPTDHRVLFSKRKMQVYTTVPYAKFQVEQGRDLFQFTKKGVWDKWAKLCAVYAAGNMKEAVNKFKSKKKR